MNLSDELLKYAIESGEVDPNDIDHSHVGASEITVVTDETQSELQEAVQDIADDVQKLENNDAAAEKLVEAADSLEAYVGRLRADREAGLMLNSQAAKYYLMGITSSLESRQIPTQIFENDVIGMNHSFESGQLEDYSREAEEKSEGLLRRLWNMLEAAAKATATFFQEFFLTIGKGATAIETSGKKLQRIGGKLGAAKGEIKKIKAKGYGKLVVGGKVDAVGAVKKVNEVYQQDIMKVAAEIQESINPIVTALSNPTPAGITEAGKKVGGALTAKEMELPGGAKAKFTPGEGEGLSKLTGAKFIVSGAEAKPEGEVEPLSAGDIKALGGALVETGTLMRGATKNSQKLLDAVNAGLKAADKAVKKAEGGTQEQIAAARELIKTCMGVTKNIKGFLPSYAKLMGEVGKNAYEFGMASASRYGKVDADAKEETKAAPGTDVALVR